MNYRSEMIQVAAVALAAVQVADLGSTELDSLLGRNSLTELLDEVRKERERQESMWGPQNHDPSWWLTILAEEVGEAARDVLESTASKKEQK